jgi:hypothetical protein
MINWVRALDGKLIEPVEILNFPSDERFEVIHIACWPDNLTLIEEVGRKFPASSKAALVLSVQSIFEHPSNECYLQSLISAHPHADLLLAPDYPTATYCESVLRRPVHVLPDPVNLDLLRTDAFSEQKKVDRIAFVMPHENFEGFNQRFVEAIPNELRSSLSEYDIDLFCSKTENLSDLYARLEKYAFVCFDSDFEGHDYELIYLAARGCVIVGGGRAEVIKRCFPITAHLTLNETLKTLAWLTKDQNAKRYVLDCAADKLEYYNEGNSRHRFISLLASTKPAVALVQNRREATPISANRVVYLDSIHHIFGPLHSDYADDEFAVVCLVKNGAEYLPSFLRHYRNMGAKHFYFIDNDSSDNTSSMLSKEADVTLYRTSLEHKKFECEIRRVIIEKHCARRWCMCVDIDELFEFPGSGSITLRQFVGYLNANGYTSVVGYMLDMFAVDDGAEGTYLEDVYTNFDLIDITKACYFSGFEAFCGRNILPSTEIGNYFGGVRQKHISSSESRFLLTKHPLVFVDHRIETMTMPHFCNGSRVADVTCVLKHYKLTTSLKDRILDGIRTDSFSFIIKDQIAAYLSLLGSGTVYQACSGSEPYLNVEQLVENGFLFTSDRYRNWLTQLWHVALDTKNAEKTQHSFTDS